LLRNAIGSGANHRKPFVINAISANPQHGTPLAAKDCVIVMPKK